MEIYECVQTYCFFFFFFFFLYNMQAAFSMLADLTNDNISFCEHIHMNTYHSHRVFRFARFDTKNPMYLYGLCIRKVWNIVKKQKTVYNTTTI